MARSAVASRHGQNTSPNRPAYGTRPARANPIGARYWRLYSPHPGPSVPFRRRTIRHHRHTVEAPPAARPTLPPAHHTQPLYARIARPYRGAIQSGALSAGGHAVGACADTIAPGQPVDCAAGLPQPRRRRPARSPATFGLLRADAAPRSDRAAGRTRPETRARCGAVPGHSRPRLALRGHERAPPGAGGFRGHLRRPRALPRQRPEERGRGRAAARPRPAGAAGGAEGRSAVAGRHRQARARCRHALAAGRHRRHARLPSRP